MIKLTAVNPDKTLNITYVNPHYITNITPVTTGTLVSIHSGPAIVVEEDAANIVAIIRGSK